ncbi:secondary thiamine-phosphate synthase enzyme [Rhinocladiella mackenziei CBS 650.93]|uniref:Rhinocladiella mackenziei CBS 650.93 unplaced genomic scaffold supercont1.1, whole genome shotgun sequence n=1 Tax=Rhinocladiella mackenziei CBS 650.93 TaxID=1442369 RepID=A0A0D2G4T9_9EURO|nr:secondary thiamine-phosphate synthase enzyme [Rhinocladiella mackenziei CBS 650.93]KIX09747.1 secondary thiamine-phosphate synthase enzyme [Rhinocladiella mackenziei CBS 650.93]
MPPTNITQSKYFTVISVLVLVLALFPGLPQFLLCLPFRLIQQSKPDRAPSVFACPAGCISYDTLPSLPCFTASNMSTSWFQKTFTLPAKSRGSYLITDHVVSSLPELKEYKVGILNLFIQHTSCGLSLNENWDSDVREDMSDALDRIAPEDRKGTLYRHSAEGLDDMPAHIKSALIGASVTIPITDGTLNTGTWQGIWYLEFRASRHSRKVVATIQGEKR